MDQSNLGGGVLFPLILLTVFVVGAVWFNKYGTKINIRNQNLEKIGLRENQDGEIRPLGSFKGQAIDMGGLATGGEVNALILLKKFSAAHSPEQEKLIEELSTDVSLSKERVAEIVAKLKQRS